ncbi:alpha/beta fold hydrolase [Paraburkholderia sp. J67]|uniref:alpha/beta hydrolase family protein n=1 Tax=Paraburkholderia sp. J67 TaxID=2805435 RepID=UPI002ABE0167|nr:alpha/beta fold hydrolase [Paraburkholderia sp. J67]
MKPVVFDGCFGWLHPAPGDHGVVLCNPFGYDALCTHRGWRKLAERLAAAGMPALRFDYPGTGDSDGNEDDPGRIVAWIDSIVAAVRYLRGSTGVARVSLVGLRLGGTLAALAAQRLGDIDGLVLLAPPIAGRGYIRELRAHRQSWLSTPSGLNADPLSDADQYVEAFGFGLHGEDIARLSGIDLQRDTTHPAQRVLVLDSADRNRVSALVEHYVAHGVDAQRDGFDERDTFVIEALYSVEPAEAFAKVAAWLTRGPALSGGATTGHAKAVDRDASGLRIAEVAATERHVVFGQYFGIYCEPDHRRSSGDADAPAVLFFNTGASHHIGDGRIFVLFARRLAALGIASLRMDLSGLGDAMPAASEITLDTIYSETSCRDAMAGVDWLVARGHARVATFGVCGGAFVGLQACARHPAIIGSYGVNLQKFIWDGAGRNPGEHGFASSKVYMRAAATPEKWRRALRGQSHPLRVARVLGQRIARRAWLNATGWIEQTTGLPVKTNDVRALIRTVHEKGVNLRLVYGDFDVGLDEARVQFGSRLGALRRYGSVQVATLPKLDHALFTRKARETTMADAQSWLFMQLMRPAPRAGAAVSEAKSLPVWVR